MAWGGVRKMKDGADHLLHASGKTIKTGLSKLKLLAAPSLLDRKAPYFSGIKRFGVAKVQDYFRDPFHTLLNLPWPRFILVFFATYMLEFLIFAFLFWAQTDRCVINLQGRFSHALWLSSRTASTLGYDSIRPNPECPLTNLTIMLQVIASSLVNFIMLGLVFARFSAPFKRATTIKFSGPAICHRHSSGYWCIGLRVANIRKHQLLKPTLRMVMTAVDSITPSNYLFEHLKIEGWKTQETNLELGFPANVVHVVTPDSPLYNLSLLEMDTRMMEILVFVDGIDAMTSKNLSARHAYNSNEVRMNEQFVPLHLEMRGKKLGMDFRVFDSTVIASEEVLGEYAADPELRSKPLAEVQNYIWHLRHQTFRRLAERNPALATEHGAPSTGLGLGRSVGGMAPSRPLNQFDKDTSNGDAAWPAYRPGVSSPSNEGTFASTSGHHESRGLLTDHVYGSSTHAALPASAAAGFEILPGPAPQSTGSSYQPPAPREVALSGALTLPPSIGAVEPSQRQRSGSASGAGIVPALFGQPSTGVNRQGSTGTHAATHN